MTARRTLTALALTAAAAGVGVATAAPASAGGIGDFLSPAFGTSCANQHIGSHARGVTPHSTGSLAGNLAGIPLSNALNQCGGADTGERAISTLVAAYEITESEVQE
jgi:hypothetical protein